MEHHKSAAKRLRASVHKSEKANAEPGEESPPASRAYVDRVAAQQAQVRCSSTARFSSAVAELPLGSLQVARVQQQQRERTQQATAGGGMHWTHVLLGFVLAIAIGDA